MWRFQQPPLPERQLRPRHYEPRETGPLRGGRTGLGGDGGVAEQSWGTNPSPGALASEPELLLNSNCVCFLNSLPEAALWNSEGSEAGVGRPGPRAPYWQPHTPAALGGCVLALTGSFHGTRQSGDVEAETVWLAELKILTLQPFVGTVCPPLS